MNRYVAATVTAAAVPVSVVLSLVCIVGLAAVERFAIRPHRRRQPWNLQ